ncbi:MULTISPECIES: GGDEF domain-containing protein [Marinobacter]|uniref:diguanylate cyclase n=1 Tax=Marinobacter excellens LAMA 842 TaxID=1306954 RepID=A0A137SIJ1_9GAMM|nr:MULTISPECIES: GGDEF domain-containing protein [Marinobacter]KXO12232.1 diguanylate cyclase/phosphodiesterase (GGDEF & EAL domain with PAS/PAC sensor(s)) [Marinobacter excellens LAMA 842]MCD1628733.1 GGDEF domain-containing protein [Marinobacter shengliensis]
MAVSRPAVPMKWQAAFESYQERMEAALAYAGAWLLLVTVLLYHFSHTHFHQHEADLGNLEMILRIPLMVAIGLAFSARWIGFPRWPARYFLRLMGICLSGLALSLLFLFALYEPIIVTQISDSMTIALFGATIMGLRSFREWLLIVASPLAIFLIAAVVAGLPIMTLVAVLIAPALLMFVTCILMAFVRKVAVDGFIARESVNEVATTDPLTGLLNRRAFMPLLQQEHARAMRAEAPFSVILADLDKFKKVNDTWGHEAGDDVLKEVAARMRDCLRKQDALCRWGGEEFLILLPGTDAEGARVVAEKCREQIQETPINMHGVHHTQTVSLGVAVFGQGEAIDHLVNRADGALYQAKQNGRNRVELAGYGN